MLLSNLKVQQLAIDVQQALCYRNMSVSTCDEAWGSRGDLRAPIGHAWWAHMTRMHSPPDSPHVLSACTPLASGIHIACHTYQAMVACTHKGPATRGMVHGTGIGLYNIGTA